MLWCDFFGRSLCVSVLQKLWEPILFVRILTRTIFPHFPSETTLHGLLILISVQDNRHRSIINE